MPSQVEGCSQTNFPNTRETGVLWFRTKEGTKTNEDLGRNDEVRTPLKEKAIHDKHRGNYGYRPIHLEFRNHVFDVNHKKGVAAFDDGSGTNYQDSWKHTSALTRAIWVKADDLIQRQLDGSKPYEHCYTDVTELSLPEGEVIYPLVLDGFTSKTILTFTLSCSLDLKQVQTILEKTFPADRYEETILHSD